MISLIKALIYGKSDSDETDTRIDETGNDSYKEKLDDINHEVIVDFSKIDVVSIHYFKSYVVIDFVQKDSAKTTCWGRHNIHITNVSQYESIISQYKTYIDSKNATNTHQ